MSTNDLFFSEPDHRSRSRDGDGRRQPSLRGLLLLAGTIATALLLRAWWLA